VYRFEKNVFNNLLNNNFVIGIDEMTIRIGGEHPTVENFKHIKSYEIPKKFAIKRTGYITSSFKVYINLIKGGSN